MTLKQLPRLKHFRFNTTLVSAFLFSALFALILSGTAGYAPGAFASTIRIANGGDMSSMDPQRTQGTWESRVMSSLFEGLTSENAKAEVIPGQAESWTISDDGLVYTFKIRKTAMWSDGQPVTANDFVYSFRRLLDPKENAYYAYLLYPVKNAEAINSGKEKDITKLGVKSVDDYTLEVTLEYPAPYFLAQLNHPTGYPVPKHAIDKYGKDWVKVGNFVSNGPYKLDEFVQGGYVKMVKSDKYYAADMVKIDTAYYYVTEDADAAFKRYRAGEFDMMEMPANQYKWALANMKDQLHVFPISGTYYYVVNARTKTADGQQKFPAKVRQAMSMAINREIVADKIDATGVVPAYGLIPPHTANYPEGYVAPWAKLSYSEKLAEAKKLMQEAGYSAKNPLKLVLRYNTLEAHKRLAIAVAAMWKQIGIETELLNTEVKVHYADLDEKNFEVARAGWIADFNDGINFLTLLKNDVAHNYGTWENDEFNKLLVQINEEIDLEKRAKIMYDAERIVMEEPSTIIPIYFYVARWVVAPKVKGFEENLDDEHWLRWLSIEE